MGEERAEELYPDWFLRTPVVAGGRFAVGYAALTADTGASIDEAAMSGHGALRVSAGLRVRAEYLQEVLEDAHVAYRGEHYAEDTLGVANAEAMPLDTLVGRRMVLVLVGSRAAPPARRRTRFGTRVPSWVTTTPASADGIYAVGAAAAHFNEHEAWIEAERQARRALAYAIVTRLKSGGETRTGGTTNGALIATTVAELRDVEIRERWRDQRQLFVLAHARSAHRPGQ